MKLGVVFPQLDIGDDPIAIRDYAQAAEALGYTHILAFDHILGMNASSRPGWKGYYDHQDMFHEPFVLFGYLAGQTERIGFLTFGLSLIAVFGVTRSLASTAWVPTFLIVGVVAGLVTLVRFLTVGRRITA